MSATELPTSPRARRRQQTIDEIVAAAWRLAARDGLASISMRELGREVGLRAQSLYGYFAAKDDLYDAMFRQGHEQLRAVLDLAPLPVGQPLDEAIEEVRRRLRTFVDFCNADPTRYQLLFQRVVPGWEPSAASYALAIVQLESLRIVLHQLGVEREESVDLWTALITGLTSQQLSNDPGGDRWARLVDEATDMFLAHALPDPPAATTTPPPGGNPT